MCLALLKSLVLHQMTGKSVVLAGFVRVLCTREKNLQMGIFHVTWDLNPPPPPPPGPEQIQIHDFTGDGSLYLKPKSLTPGA